MEVSNELLVTRTRYHVRVTRVGYRHVSKHRHKEERASFFSSFEHEMHTRNTPFLKTHVHGNAFPPKLLKLQSFCLTFLHSTSWSYFSLHPTPFRFRWFTLRFGWQVFTVKFSEPLLIMRKSSMKFHILVASSTGSGFKKAHNNSSTFMCFEEETQQMSIFSLKRIVLCCYGYIFDIWYL